ncbi:MAG: Uma2 family endonuclease [Chloroflexi bacterium]|nr:Uma2 family endonuclease [Chloroflexota bacterium]
MAVERLGSFPKPHSFTVEEYFAFEERSEFKHEFIDGVIYDCGDPYPESPVHPDFVPGHPMPHLFTVAEYLAFEAESEFKHEFIDGIIYDMTGGTFYHSKIKVNVFRALLPQLDDKLFEILNSDMCVKVDSKRYVYPDLSVVRGQPQLEDNDTTLLNPVLAVEVTSPASQDYDRVEKRAFYSAIASLQAYLVIDQHRVHVELYTRREDGWLWQTFDSMEDIARLRDLGCDLALAAIYRAISFP